MYSQEFKDWAKSKGMFREFDGFNSEASNLPLFWEAWQAAEKSERERCAKLAEIGICESEPGPYNNACRNVAATIRNG